MTTRCNWRIAGLLALVLLESAAFGGSLRKIWELDLSAEIKGPSASDGIQPGILAIRFSPDGKQIAVASNPYRFGRPVRTRVVVLPIEGPRAKRLQFDTTDIASDSESLGPGGPPSISWSPAGDFILAGLDLIRLKDGSACQIPNSLGHGFLGVNRIVADVLLGVLGDTVQKQIETFDSECKPTGTWKPPYQEWTIRDISADRGFVSMTVGGGDRGLKPEDAGELIVLDLVANKAIRSWPAKQSGGESRFADHGRVLCAGDDAAFQEDRIPPRCMNIDSGEVIVEAGPGIVGGAPFSAAENGTRVVASDYNSIFNLRFQEYDTVLKRRVVWDFRKNIEIASWKADTQTYTLLSSKPVKEPFVFAISPDGDYVAEGGNGRVRLYKIEP